MNELSRDRIGWWLFVAILAVAVAFIAHAFVGILVLGVFGYYAIRPISDHISEHVGTERRAAMLTIATVLVPVLLLLVYASANLLRLLQERLGQDMVKMLTSRLQALSAFSGSKLSNPMALLRNPPSTQQLSQLSVGGVLDQVMQALGAVFGGLLLVSLAIALTYTLLEFDERISDTVATLVGGEDTTAYAFAKTVDVDLESIFFGNLLFALIMGVIATVTYAATNLVAPDEVRVPMVLTLGFLTGISSLIPVVVGKVVYLPVVAYLALQVPSSNRVGYVFVGGVLLVYVLLLDLLPQSFIQPYVSGRNVNPFLLLFAYILGPMFFGWYGFFLMPIIFIVVLETVRIVLPELLSGDPIAPEATVAENIATDPEEAREESPDEPGGDSASGSGSQTSGSGGDGSSTPQS